MKTKFTMAELHFIRHGERNIKHLLRWCEPSDTELAGCLKAEVFGYFSDSLVKIDEEVYQCRRETVRQKMLASSAEELACIARAFAAWWEDLDLDKDEERLSELACPVEKNLAREHE